MNPDSPGRAVLLAKKVELGIAKIKGANIVIAPPFPFLLPVGKVLKRARLGAQDLFWEAEGAFTGEVSWHQLKHLRVEYVIIGHSERRALGESDEMVNKKIKAALQAGLKPVVCIANAIQLKKALKTIQESRVKTQDSILAFEPLSAIGTGKPYDVGASKRMRNAIKYPFVLYGGSVNSKNAPDYVKKAGFQGFLVGGASLKAGEFVKIVQKICQ
ncbi:MAG: triosephosphate isomerase [Parcubacteria group bacterium Gr01-1014_30]|nr:MAG: triosephosphate isomerase [Parcubacteria group bacterium Gr01-1014_30]